mgnify:CR=1 FL=1
MPNPDPLYAPTVPLWRGKTPALPEFFALMNALPNASLLVDRSKETVLLYNASFHKLTSFSQAELIGAPLARLFQTLDMDLLVKGEEQITSLNRRGRKSLEVSVTASALDAQAQWMLLSVSPASQNAQAIQHEQLAQKLRNFSRLNEETSLDTVLNTSLKICLSVFGGGHLAIYLADPHYPQLKRFVCHGTEGFFPETMDSSDLVRLSNTNIWVPGRRVQTELHRFARIAGLSYLASTPLGQGHALTGLLVVGDVDMEAPPHLGEYLELCGTQIGMAVQHFLLVENLRGEIMKQGRLNAINAAVFENSEEGVMVLDPDLAVREINSAAEWMLGYANWEAEGQPVENILIGPERLIPALEAACQGIPTHNIGNVQLHRRNGQSFPAHMQTIPVQKNGKLLAVIVFLSDVSVHEQIRLRTQQLEHRAILGDVTAVFAHEVRNPINNISTGLQLVSMRLNPDDPNRETLSRMENDCTRLTHLMESVLAFSRPIEPKFEAVDCIVLLRRLLDRWRPRMLRMNVELFFQGAENTPRIVADPRSLEQVFINLVSNAVEAMSASGGTLAVKVAPSEKLTTPPHVEISISDTGPGIPDDLREHIFEPFVSSKISGTGLGLAITKRIVTAHHGSINVDSFPGGTVFQLQLPAVHGG